MGKKKGKGRPAFEPTEQEKQIVSTASAMGLKQEAICQLVQRDGAAIDPKTLRKHFRPELDQGIARAHFKILRTAYEVATDPKHKQFAAMNIWLQKTQLGKREGMVQELTGRDGAPLISGPRLVVNVGKTEVEPGE